MLWHMKHVCNYDKINYILNDRIKKATPISGFIPKVWVPLSISAYAKI